MANEIKPYSQVEKMIEGFSLLPENASDIEIKTAAENLTKLKKMLEAAGIYQREAAKFLRLEAQTWVDIANACAVVKTTKHRASRFGDKNSPNFDQVLLATGYSETTIEVTGEFNTQQIQIIKLLASMTAEARAKVPEFCAKKLRSISSYAYKATREHREEKAELKLVEWGEYRINEFERTGKTDISKGIPKTVEVNVDEQIINDFRDGLRNRLRKRSAIGIGDNLYVNKDKADRNEIIRALQIRQDSINADTDAFQDLVERLNASEMLAEQQLKEGEDLDQWSGMSLAFNAIKAYKSADKHRSKKWFEREFRRMVNRDGEYSYHCGSDYKNLREAFQNILDGEVDGGLPNCRYLVDRNGLGTTYWIEDQLQKVANARYEYDMEQQRIAVKKISAAYKDIMKKETGDEN